MAFRILFIFVVGLLGGALPSWGTEIPGYPTSHQALIPIEGFTVHTYYPPGPQGPFTRIELVFQDANVNLERISYTVSTALNPDAALELLKKVAAENKGLIAAEATDDLSEDYSFNSADKKICYHMISEKLKYVPADSRLSDFSITGQGTLYLANTNCPN